MIRRLKLSYMLYNLFNKGRLEHNVKLYKKLGLRKSYFSPISSADFRATDAAVLQENQNLPALEEIAFLKTVSVTARKSIHDFQDNGYCVIDKFLDNSQVDKINNTIDQLQSSGKLKFKYGNKLMFAIHQSPFLQDLWEDKALLELLSCLIQGEAALFQSINFIYGSQQKTHSDSIHMTTFPLGGLLGVWMALEDIGLDNGPLHYYPKSHKLPYYLNEDYDNVGTKFFLGKNGYGAYEKMLAEKVQEQKIERQVFTAKKGDLFIWHANLLHGGEPHTNKERTRKSMVMHYFDLNRICYHEISQRPALFGRAI